MIDPNLGENMGSFFSGEVRRDWELDWFSLTGKMAEELENVCIKIKVFFNQSSRSAIKYLYIFAYMS